MKEYIHTSDFKDWHPEHQMASNGSIVLGVELDFTKETYTYVVHRYSEVFIRTPSLEEAIKVFNERVRTKEFNS